MKTNIGRADRVIRIALGLLLPLLYATDQIGAWGLLGLPLLATGLIRFCPLYALLGIQTCRTRKAL